VVPRPGAYLGVSFGSGNPQKIGWVYGVQRIYVPTIDHHPGIFKSIKQHTILCLAAQIQAS